MTHPGGAVRPLALAWACGLALMSCTDESNPVADDTSGDNGSPSMVPDFSLVDTNATSPSAGEAVSPRDYRERVSAWYFGHAN